MRIVHRLIAVVVIAMGASSARASVVITFDGLVDRAVIGSHYAAQHVTFSPNLVSILDTDSGGSGKFSGNPSENTVAGWARPKNVFIDSDLGFTGQISMWYSTRQTGTTIRIWSGPHGQGDLLSTATLLQNSNGKHNEWDELLIPFNGVAQSIEFAGKAGTRTYFDDLTFNLAPVPAAGLLGALGLLGAAWARRRLG